jgi:hypothetical protein
MFPKHFAKSKKTGVAGWVSYTDASFPLKYLRNLRNNYSVRWLEKSVLYDGIF